MRVTISIHDELWLAAKLRAKERGQTLAIHEVLDEGVPLDQRR